MKINVEYEIDDQLIQNYIDHFDNDKTDIFQWEKTRGELHNLIFEKLGVDRFSDEGQRLNKAIDKYCIPIIEKKDYFAAGLKRISNSENETEMQMNALALENKRRFEEIREKREHEKYANKCRICSVDLPEGTPRYNDHLFGEGVNGPICMDCAKNNPDEHHINFKRSF